MKERIITEKLIAEFYEYLQGEEKSTNTIGKYLRDVRAFAKHISGKEITKENVIAYKNKLLSDG